MNFNEISKLSDRELDQKIKEEKSYSQNYFRLKSEQEEYQERMGSPEMEYLQYLSEHPELANN